MKAQNALYSVWNRNTNHLLSSRPGTDLPEIASQILANTFCPGPSYYYVVELGLQRFVYVSPGITQVLGANPDQLQIKDIVERLHPADVNFFARCEEIITDFFLHKIAPEQRMQYKTSFTLRFRHNNGEYRHILHQAVAIELDGFGQMSRILGIHCDIGHLVTGVQRRLSLIHLGDGPSFLNIEADRPDDQISWQAASTSSFSERELQIIRLFACGHTADEIAGMTHLSVRTVRTHAQNVLRKSGCANMTALVAMCVRAGWA